MWPLSVTVSLEIKSVTKRPGKLYALLSSKEPLSIGTEKPVTTNVVDIKSTETDVVVLTKAGKVIVLVEGKSPKELVLPGKAVQISGGCEHAACLLETGQVYVWGSFENPGFMFREPYVPMRVLRDQKIVQISSGRDHLVALTNDGHVFTMGCGAQGQLGRIGERSSMDGGRRGPKLLLAPDRLHMNYRHRAAQIWATRCGTFYRDWRTGSIFGCGDNRSQNVAPAKKTDQMREFIFKPVLTTFKDVQAVGDQMTLTEDGHLLTCTQDKDNLFQWRSLDVTTVTSVLHGPTNSHFIDSDGDVFEWTPNGIVPVYIATENKSAPAINICRTEQMTFLLIA